MPNLVHVYSIVVAQYAPTHRSKGQRSRSHSYENRQKRHFCLFFCLSVLKKENGLSYQHGFKILPIAMMQCVAWLGQRELSYL